MANIPVSSGYWTPAQLALMAPGARLDIAGPWKLWIFGQPGGTNPATNQPYDWIQQGLVTGTRTDMNTQYPTMLAGLEAMVTLKLLAGFILIEVPVNWSPTLGDNFYVFPDSLT